MHYICSYIKHFDMITHSLCTVLFTTDNLVNGRMPQPCGGQKQYDVSCHTATGRIIPLSLSFQEKRIMRRVYIGALEQPRASHFLYLDISLF